MHSSSVRMTVTRASIFVAVTGTMASSGSIHNTVMAMGWPEATQYAVFRPEANPVTARASYALAAALSPMSWVQCAQASGLVRCPRWMVSLPG
jgi:hypothetical protein